MATTITEQEAEKRLERREELSRSGRSPETQILFDWLKAELDDIKARLDALEG